ncbi:hypothetical protein SPI_01475 [Niveomyces insectorum RCEF 264]|uniref:Uncharacterized protein n=1 Tax=Niveomyces insectorum RCEF 264 TaxID=1081102 RepID=A0A167YZW4_9HYPO|nr:hypothetical protein SPI_01475 [Niveomyces insectorum RCEF 264]
MRFSSAITSTAGVFGSTAIELAQQRFSMDAVTAGWYSAMAQYLGFFFVPLVGVFVNALGRRLGVMLVGSLGLLLAMSLAAGSATGPRRQQLPQPAGSVAIAALLVLIGCFQPTLGALRWNRQKRITNGHVIHDCKEAAENDPQGRPRSIDAPAYSISSSSSRWSWPLGQCISEGWPRRTALREKKPIK